MNFNRYIFEVHPPIQGESNWRWVKVFIIFELIISIVSKMWDFNLVNDTTVHYFTSFRAGIDFRHQVDPRTGKVNYL